MSILVEGGQKTMYAVVARNEPPVADKPGRGQSDPWVS